MKQIKEQLLYRKDIWWKLNKQEELEFPQLISECKQNRFPNAFVKNKAAKCAEWNEIIYSLRIRLKDKF